MRPWRCLSALLLFVSASLAAEIYPVVGDPLKAEVLSVTDKEIVFQQGEKKIVRPIKEILKVDFRDLGKLPSDKPYSLVELTDGTQLLASKVLYRKRDFELTLLSGSILKLPGSVVAHVLFDAAKEENRRDWKSRVFNSRGKEAVVIKRKAVAKEKDKEVEYEIASTLEATLGEGDETGSAISFAVTIEGETTSASRKLASLRGLIFKHILDPKATPFSCKLLDTSHDVVMVSSLSFADGGVTVTTPAGAKLQFRHEQIARLDYTQGRLEYLSDLTPSKMVTRSNLDEDPDRPDQWHVFKDSNLDKRPLTLSGVTYAKGLALKPYAELLYDLKGEYREFEAHVGIDDGVSAAGACILIIEGDGKELANVTISSEDKVRHKHLKLNVKDVQKLRVLVKADGEFDTARHLDLADAKLRKEDR